MKMFKKVIGISLLMPLMGFAASEKISDWGFEPNGELRAVVGNKAVYVSPESESAYFNTLMAARLGWKVEAVNGQLLVDATSVPPAEASLLASCATASCTYNNVSRVEYGCVLDEMYALLTSEKVKGTTSSWPDKNADSGVATFSIPDVGTFSLNVVYNEPQQKLSGTITTKPPMMPYSLLWGYVDTQVASCSQ